MKTTEQIIDFLEKKIKALYEIRSLLFSAATNKPENYDACTKDIKIYEEIIDFIKEEVRNA